MTVLSISAEHLQDAEHLQENAEHLQEDLQILSKWTKLWKMKINVEKCAVLRCTRSLSPIQHNYILSRHKIAIKDRHVYLVFEIDNNLMFIPYSYKQLVISLPKFLIL